MIHHGDLFDVLPTLEAESVDACVCDPPYELAFMGKKWDASGVAFNPETWRQVFRVLKPGAHLVAFGGTRTFHRMTVAIEDSGFEIRDCLSWLYGSGFPKSRDISKDIDRTAGAVRPRDKSISPTQGMNALLVKHGGQASHWMATAAANGEARVLVSNDVPLTDLAKQWQGWGTALKPSWEPCILARKPLRGTVAANVAQFGTGAINVDACRIAGGERPVMVRTSTVVAASSMSGVSTGATPNGEMTDLGRWPANVLLDEEAAAVLDEQSGEVGGGFGTENRSESRGRYGDFSGSTKGRLVGFGDSGGASRFFYVAKPSREERDLGCYHLPAKSGGEATDRTDGSAGVNSPRAGAGRTGGARNIHPTVKPVELMRWLVRLVTPPDGVVMDPFMGSGTTGMACRYELRRFIGIEREAEYIEIAERRIAAVAPLFGEATA